MTPKKEDVTLKEIVNNDAQRKNVVSANLQIVRRS